MEDTVTQYPSYPFFDDLVKPFRKSQRKTLCIVLCALVQAGQARTLCIAHAIAVHLKIRLDSAVNRFYRLLRNPRIDETVWLKQWLSCLASKAGSSLLVPLDWTEWPHGLRLLVAAVVFGSRAIPLLVHAHGKVVSSGSQNRREHLFVRLLALCAKELGMRITLLCDRGFRRVGFIRLLQTIQMDFVIRLMEDVTVHLESGETIKLKEVLLPVGKVQDFGEVSLRSDQAVKVRIVGYLAPGAKEPWYLATSRQDPAVQIVRLYDRRMTVEEQFRDTKGSRFGARLGWTQFRDAAQLGWVVRLVGVALLVWMASGECVTRKNPSFLWVCAKKGPRISVVTIGMFACMSAAFGQGVGPPMTILYLRRILPTPALRKLSSFLGAAK